MAKKIHCNYVLIWNRQDKLLTLPIQIANSTKTDTKSDTLICDKCLKKPSEKNKKILKQQYVCSNCGCVYYSIGFIKKRYNYDYDVIYDNEEKRNYLKTELDKEIIVKDEMPLAFALMNYGEIIDNSYEIFNNDTENGKLLIKKIWEFLHENVKCLLVYAKYRGNDFMGLVYPSLTGKLILLSLKSEDIVKSPYNTSLIDATYVKSGFIPIKKEKEEKFFFALSNNEKLEYENKREEPKMVISEDFFSGG